MDQVVIILSDLFQIFLHVVVVFVVGVVVVVEEEVALAEALEVVEDGGDLVAGAVEEVGEEEDEDVAVVGIFLHLGTFETVSILTVSCSKFLKMLM